MVKMAFPLRKIKDRVEELGRVFVFTEVKEKIIIISACTVM